MNSRNLRWLAWGILGIYIFLVVIGMVLQAAIGVTFVGFPIPVMALLYTILGIWIGLGILIVIRHPSNPVGWLLCIGMLLPALDPLAFGYAVYSQSVSESPLPGITLAILWLNWSGMPFGVYFLTLLYLRFPNGKLLSSRWRALQWAASGSLGIYIGLKALEPGAVAFSTLAIDNPLAASPSTWKSLEPIMWAAFSTMAICYGAAWWSLVIRLRRGKGDEHQQVKWVIPPAALFGIGIPILASGEFFDVEPISQFGGAIHMLAISGIVIGSTFAIFKYHLYDIDIIIRRTLVYGALTGSLGLIYFALVTVLGNLITSISGQESSAAIVISTLAIAALFTPLRHRIQDFIDRRFYRQKYDAVQALSAFSLAVRDEVNAEQIAILILSIVEETVQPENVSIWLWEQKKQPHSYPVFADAGIDKEVRQ